LEKGCNEGRGRIAESCRKLPENEIIWGGG
jgi:hypothetical protein